MKVLPTPVGPVSRTDRDVRIHWPLASVATSWSEPPRGVRRSRSSRHAVWRRLAAFSRWPSAAL